MTVNTILCGDNIATLKTLPDNSVNCCVTSPPYFGLRDYGIDGQIGLEETPDKYIQKLVDVFQEVKRVLRDDGTLWVNIGDSYAGGGNGRGQKSPMSAKQASNKGATGQCADHQRNLHPKDFGCKAKDLIGIPWRLAFALRDNGWYLRQDIIWHKPSVMPESVRDRFCKSHEYIFLFSKKSKYYFDLKFALELATGYDGRKVETVASGTYSEKAHGIPAGKIRERWPQRGYADKDGETGFSEQHHGKNIPTGIMRTKRDVWTVASEPSGIEHYAMYPQKLILPCILCGCPENGVVLDPFMGSGTTGVVAVKNFRKYIGCELNQEYIRIAEQRIANEMGLFNE